MPRIDPHQLLKTLGVLLAPSGGIKSNDEVIRLVTLMHKFSKKLVSKCIYVKILKATTQDLLDRFLEERGWDLLNVWFSDAIKNENWDFCIEMIQLFAMCPISADRLKNNVETNQAPRLINQLRNEPRLEASIRLLATEVYEKWVSVVSPEKTEEKIRNSTDVASSSDEAEKNGSISLLQSLADEVSESIKKEETSKRTSSKSKDDGRHKKHSSGERRSSLSSSSEKKREREREEDRKRRRERDERDSKDRKKFRVDRRDEVDPEEKKRIKELARRMKEDQAKKEKDRETLSKIGIGGVTTLGKIPKIPKKTPSSSDIKDKEKEKQKSGSGLSFSDMLGGLDSKPKTVRTPLIKNKTAAMLEGMTKSPTSSSRSPKDSKDSKSSSRHSSSSRSSSSSSSNKEKDSKKEPLPFTSSYSTAVKRESERSSSRHRPTLNIPENKKRQSEESSPKTPKSPHNVSDSSGFMDAIFSSINKTEPSRKKKRRLSETDSGKKDTTPEKAKKAGAPEPEKEEKEEKPAPAAFSFYRDTLETPEEEEDKPTYKKPEKKDIKVKKEDDDSMDTSTNDADAGAEAIKEEREDSASPKQSPKKEGSDTEEDKESDKDSDGPREVKGILVYHRGKGKRNKAIKWKTDAKLVDVKYFEMDEDERVNVNKLKFENMRAIELKMEKEAVKHKDEVEQNLEQVELAWYTPKKIDIGDTREPFTPGESSEEKKVQFAREKMVLEALYFNKAMTPPTPAEPDPEMNPVRKEQLLIPLEDKEAGEEAEIDFKAVGWPEPKVNAVDEEANLSFSLPPALSHLLSSVGNIQNFMGNVSAPLSREEQDTLAAQTQAMQAMGMLPGVDMAPTFPPPSGENMPPAGPPGMPPGPGMLPPGPPHSNGAGYMAGPPPGFDPMAGPPPQGPGPRGYHTGPPPHGPPHGPPLGPPPHHMGGPPPRHMNHNGFHRGGRGGYDRGGYDRGGYDNGRRFHGGGGGGGRGRGFRSERGGFREHHREGGGGRVPEYDDAKYKTRPCKYFLQGHCSEGDNCRFIHPRGGGGGHHHGGHDIPHREDKRRGETVSSS